MIRSRDLQHYGSLLIEAHAYSRKAGMMLDSGINATTSDLWTIVVRGESGEQLCALTIPTARLRTLCEGRELNRCVQGGSNPTECYVLPLSAVFGDCN
jgi:hypothetical protein